MPMLAFLAAATIAVGSWLSVPGGTWSPGADVVAAAASKLQAFTEQRAQSKGLTLPQWSSYTFQYQGRMLYGRRVLYINAFCSSPPAYARQEFVHVLDGGPCYFFAYYDPATKQFVGLAFNGFA